MIKIILCEIAGFGINGVLGGILHMKTNTLDNRQYVVPKASKRPLKQLEFTGFVIHSQKAQEVTEEADALLDRLFRRELVPDEWPDAVSID
jgi:hypothetical protein